MEKLETWEEVWQALQMGYIVLTKAQERMSFFALQRDKICVYHEFARYYLTKEDFRTLFSGPFYVYEKSEETGIDSEKDEEYYSWWHK